MSKTQLTVLLAGAAIFLASELFPPWYYKDSYMSARRNAGYHFYRQPPVKASEEQLRKMFSVPADEYFISGYVSLRLDKGRLDIQRLLIVCLTLGILVFQKRKTVKTPGLVGWSAVLLSLILAGLLILRLGMVI